MTDFSEALREAVRQVIDETLLTREEAARQLKVSTKTFDRMRARGEIAEPRVKSGRILRWSKADILRR